MKSTDIQITYARNMSLHHGRIRQWTCYKRQHVINVFIRSILCYISRATLIWLRITCYKILRTLPKCRAFSIGRGLTKSGNVTKEREIASKRRQCDTIFLREYSLKLSSSRELAFGSISAVKYTSSSFRHWLHLSYSKFTSKNIPHLELFLIRSSTLKE